MDTPNDTGETRSAPSEGYRERLLDAILPFAAEHGWTDKAVQLAADSAGLSEGQVMLACPNGASDLLDALTARAAETAGKRLAEPDIAALKIRER